MHSKLLSSLRLLSGSKTMLNQEAPVADPDFLLRRWGKEVGSLPQIYSNTNSSSYKVVCRRTLAEQKSRSNENNSHLQYCTFERVLFSFDLQLHVCVLVDSSAFPNNNYLSPLIFIGIAVSSNSHYHLTTNPHALLAKLTHS